MCPDPRFESGGSSPGFLGNGRDPSFSARRCTPGTRNLAARARGFSIVAAIFLLVVLALLGTAIVYVTGLQQSGHQLDILGTRAYQAARAGVEWAAFQVLDPNSAIATAALPACPAASTNLSGLAGSLATFTVTVTCDATINAPTTEGNRNVGAYRIVANACNQPAAGACPNPTPANGYVERELQATFSKCKDPAAAAPRFACN